MIKKIVFVVALIMLETVGFAQQKEEKPVDNYTIKRLLVFNDKNELIVVKYNGTWNIPALRYNQSETYNQSLQNLAKEMGVQISKPKIGGIFSFTYDFNEEAALRMFYVANYKSGEIKPKIGWDDIKWISKEDFLKLKNQDVYSLMASKIVEDGSVLWGGAFFLYKENEQVKFKITEEFYDLR